MDRKFRYTVLALSFGTMLSSSFFLGACSTTGNGIEERRSVAQRIAGSAGLEKRQIDAEPFRLTVFERVVEREQPVTIYIEGDGYAWVSRRMPSFDPTPKRPTALSLAAVDPSDNVIYMARPCQYSKGAGLQKVCERKYWTTARFSSETVVSMNKALDEIKARYDIPAFDLVGYSGGGAMAVLMAAQRDDIASIRTVAGNLDHVKHSKIHRVSFLSGSLNARDYAARVADIPQRHFIGGEDKNVTGEVYESYARAASGNCVVRTIVPNATHEKGWVEKWRGLLALPVECQ